MLAPPAQAECLGSCMDRVVGGFFTTLGYGVLALVILIMLIRVNWRRAGLKLLAISALIAVGLPLVSQGWQAWVQHAMEGREIAGTPPDLAGRTVLVIIGRDGCASDPCPMALRGREGPTYVLQDWAVNDVDFAGPLVLSDLPLQQVTYAADQGGGYAMRKLTPSERAAAAAKIDYVVFAALPHSLVTGREFEAALRRNPALTGMADAERLRFAMGPLEPGSGKLDISTLRFDLLDLSRAHRALALPLALYRWVQMENVRTGLKEALAALCRMPDGTYDKPCSSTVIRW